MVDVRLDTRDADLAQRSAAGPVPVRTFGPRNRDRRPWTGIDHHEMLI